jgi:pimeloyl-ACP methyl ester carboxylesterase
MISYSDKVKQKDIYYVLGQTKERLVLFLHGNSSSQSSFRHQLNQKWGCGMAAADLLGHGESFRYNDEDFSKNHYSLPDQIEMLKLFIDSKLQCRELILVGHSFGGHLAIALAQIYPEKVKGVFICNMLPLNSSTDASEAFSADKEVFTFFNPDPSKEEVNELADYLKLGASRKKFLKDFLGTDPRFRMNLGSSLSEQVELNELDFLKNSKVKTHIMLTLDGLYQKNYTRKVIDNTQSNPNIKVEFLNVSSHFPQFDHPEEFNYCLKRFIDNI